MNAQGVRRGFSVQQSDLMCKRGCGFYGNAVWQGLCSKCWRQENQLQREEEAASASSREEARSRPESSRTHSVPIVKRLFTSAPKTPARRGTTVSLECVTHRVHLAMETWTENTP
uniref:A20-type domain-containing protein n=1 Tax=Sinocyclocheilus anshuiensis TaxID=1608454 RepID=A0A671KHH9_9TELE